MRLGRFVQDAGGAYHGTVKAYGLPETTVMFVPQTSQDGKPYFELSGNPAKSVFDGGAAFPKQKGDLSYLSVVLDSPMFPAPVHAGLFRDKLNPEMFNLVWDRPKLQTALAADIEAVASEEAETEAPIKTNPFNRLHAMKHDR